LLERPKLGIEAMAGDELSVPAPLDYPPVAHDQDLVGVLDGGQSMGNDKRGAVVREQRQALLNDTLRGGIESRSRFVEKQDLRLL